ncbi:MAG: glycoside hydrolase, family [Bacteroidota bacterium]|jgi:hypothetical protein|nr:glycoside hydrolase, family [Bacteroidota bacterium]
MKKTLLLFSFIFLLLTSSVKAQLINPGFETWTNDMLVPTAMNPNSGNDTYGWWDFNYFNSSFLGSSPVSVSRSSDTVHGGNYSVRVETKVYTPTSWNMYRYWGIPYIGHEYNDTLGILFDGKVNVTNQTFKPGIACTQHLTQFKFFYQYRPNGNDTAECRVALLSSGSLVAGGVFKTGAATGSAGWQQAVVNFTYINNLTPDTLYILYSSSSLDYKPKAGSVLWIDDASVSFTTGVEEFMAEDQRMVFPNPSNGSFSVRNNSKEMQTVEVFNVIGEMIYSSRNSQSVKHIDISEAPKGIYFVRILTGGNQHTEKIVVR